MLLRLIIGIALSVSAYAQMASHPRIWLTPTVIAAMQAKKTANTSDWAATLAAADALLANVPPTITIASISNGNPAVVTVTEASLPWSQSGMEIWITGLTGNWAALNNGTAYHGWTMTITGTQTFTVPINTTSFGALSGTPATWLGHANADATFKSGFFSWGYRSSTIYDNAHQLGLVYVAKKADGDADWTTYRDKLKEYYNFFAALGPAGIAGPITPTNGYDSRFSLVAMALMHDWLWNDLNSTERANGAETLDLWSTQIRTTGYTATPTGAGAYVSGIPQSRVASNFWGGHVLGVGLAGLAMYDEDNTAGQSHIDWARGQWDTYFVPQMVDPSGMLSGGFHWETWQYGGTHLVRLMRYALAVQTATGEQILTTAQAKQWASKLPHLRRPDRWGTDQLGTNSATASVGVMTKGELLMLSYLLEGTTEGQMVQYMLGNWGTLPGCCTGSEVLAFDAYDRLMFEDTSRTATNYNTLATEAYVPGANLIVSRSDWNDTATWITFRASTNSNSDHTARTAGNVEIFRGADRLLGNIHNQDGTGGSTTNSSESSTLYWSDDASFDGIATTGNYLGGQKLWGAYTTPTHKETATFAYSLANLTEMYNNTSRGTAANRTMKYFFREFLELKDGTVVVWDRVKAKLDSYTKYQRWHTLASLSSVDASTYSSTVGSSKLFIRSLLPAVPTLTAAQNGSTSTYHLDIADSATSTDYNALTVFYVTDSAGSLPTTTLISTIDSDFVGVQVDGATPKVAVFAAPVTANGTTYTPAAQTSSSFTTTHSGTARYVVAGLSAATYTITLGGVEQATGQAVGPDGTLTFTGAAGAYVITQDGAAPVAPTITSASPLAGGYVGTGYSSTLTATGDTPITWAVSAGSLPAGLSLSSAGVISGTPSAAETAAFTVSATNAAGADTQDLSITISTPQGSGVISGKTIRGKIVR